MAVYFMQPVSGGPVKIGYSFDVDTRRRQLESHYDCDLVVLAIMEGSRDEEAEIHARFAHLRIGLEEQFRPDTELMEFIGRLLLADANPDATGLQGVPVGRTHRGVKLEIDLAQKVYIIAHQRGISIADYLSTTFRSTIDRDYAKVVRETGEQ